MDVRIKAIVVLLPFGIALYVGLSLLQPAMDEANTKEGSLSTKRQENDSYSAKLQGSNKVSRQEMELKQQIEKLRDSVPKSPEIDLLTIDLEKMCKDAGMNMIGLTAPKNAPTAAPKNTEDSTSKKKDKLKNLLKGGGAGAPAETAESSGGSGGGELEQSAKSFTVTGDYEGLQKLVHELETYQRVVRIDDIDLHITEKSTGKEKIKVDDSSPAEGSEGGDPRLLFITMTLTTYFLP